MTSQIQGSFDITLKSQSLHEGAEGVPLGRLSIAKQFYGELEGTSRGEMLSTRTAVEGSAGYVAIEYVTGMLQGRSGSFVLQHSGTMTRGTPHLSVTVVPDSGTDQLVGLAGTMTISNVNGQHTYEFTYTLEHS